MPDKAIILNAFGEFCAGLRDRPRKPKFGTATLAEARVATLSERNANDNARIHCFRYAVRLMLT
jgi:hypothetical protein